MENNNTAILEGLNDEQKAAVRCVKGPVLIVAGAGSGKTRVLTSRIAYAINEGVDPSRILALTFTKKAATEMKDRIALIVGEQRARRIWMGTFHSVFIRFLRGYADFLGFPSSFTIYDTSDSQALVKTIVKEMNLDDKAYKPKNVLTRISNAKNEMCLPGHYANDRDRQEADYHSKMPRIKDIYLEYMTRCKKSGVMDFDDILVYMNILFRQNPEAMKEIAGRFDYILVDEYQDTNYTQYLILKQLAQFHKNICVVGDDSQSIYAFRGAKIANILNFQKDYGNANVHVFRLERNYRSTQTIVDAANSLIEHNKDRIRKICYSREAEGERIRLIDAYTPEEEARLVASAIKGRIARDGAQYSDFAVFYRTNAQSRAFEQELRAQNLPYRIYSGKSFFDRAEVKDLMAYFKLVVNNNDDESLKRIINKPARAIGDTTVAAIAAAAADGKVSMFKAACGDTLPNFGLRAAAVEKVHTFCKMILGLSEKLASTDAFDLAKSIAYDSGIYQAYKADMSVEGQAKFSNVDSLLSNVKEIVERKHNEAYEDIIATLDEVPEEMPESDLPLVTLGDFLEDISLASAIDMDDSDEEGEGVDNKIALMTVHTSKGLEFPYVYVTGMEESLFPAGGSLITPEELAEERRLFYVAITRAKKSVALSFSKVRMKEGQTDYHAPSRFLYDIDPKYILNPLNRQTGVSDDEAISRRPSNNFGYGRSSRPAAPRPVAPSAPRTSGVTPIHRPAQPPVRTADPNFQASPISDLKVGQRVEHNRFGFGVILELTGSIADRTAVVKFDDYGEKKLILKYAKFRIV